MDYFLLIQMKGLEEVSILPQIFCNMHIAHCNMHIAIEPILPLTHIPASNADGGGGEKIMRPSTFLSLLTCI